MLRHGSFVSDVRFGVQLSLLVLIVCGGVRTGFSWDEVIAKSEEGLPIDLDGYCPVSLVTKLRWEKGDSEFAVVHEGHTYWCADQDARKAFLKSPRQFAPVFGGDDIVEYVDNMQRVAGKRRHGVFYRMEQHEPPSIYLFTSEENCEQFSRDPKRYVELLSRLIAARR